MKKDQKRKLNLLMHPPFRHRLDPRPFGRASCHKCPAIYKVPAYYCTNMKDVPMVKSCPCGFDAINYRGCIWDIQPGDRTVKDKSGFRRREAPGEAGKRAADECLDGIRKALEEDDKPKRPRKKG